MSLLSDICRGCGEEYGECKCIWEKKSQVQKPVKIPKEMVES